MPSPLSRVGALGATLLVVASALAPPRTAHAFGGEDPLFGNDWYHQVITRDAATRAGFAPSVAERILWYNDWLDAYLYNPVYWVGGGYDRVRAAFSAAPELERLHFDDLGSFEQVRAAWRRYLTGAAAGLYWAMQHDDVEGARAILGVLSHAVQDFYSHSSWVDDPARRGATWLATPVDVRDRQWLWTGYYEHDLTTPEAHGKPNLMCSVMASTRVGKELMDLACAGISPLSNTQTCDSWRTCRTKGSSEKLQVLGVTVPDNVVYYDPPGIALDSKWLSRIAVQMRDVNDVSGDRLFEVAKALATDATVQVFAAMGDYMNSIGGAAFWLRVQRDAPSGTKEDAYEDFNWVPYQFLSAGNYPDDELTTEFFLRVELGSAGARRSGTNADIRLEADGKSFLLDYGRNANPLVAINDFERNSRTTYTVGPFDRIPSTIALRNDAPSFGAVLRSAWEGFRDKLRRLGRVLGDVFLAILAGSGADHIGTDTYVFSPAALQQAQLGEVPFELRVDGGDEGDYAVRGRLRYLSAVDELEYRYEVVLDTLKCYEEAKWDRGTSQDEPFIVAVLTPLPGELQYHVLPDNDDGYWSDVDSGNTRSIGERFVATAPPNTGALALTVGFFEADSELDYPRRRAREQIVDSIERDTKEDRDSFARTFTASIAADWKLGDISLYAFSRGTSVSAGYVLPKTSVNAWIDGGERRSFGLSGRWLRGYLAKASELEEAAVPPPPPGPPVTIGGITIPGVLPVFYPPDRGDVFISESNGTAFGIGLEASEWFCIGSEQCELGDLNGDGYDDLVAFRRGTRGEVYVSFSEASGNYREPEAKEFERFCFGSEVCKLADVNGDGRDDLVSFDRSQGFVHVALSNGTRIGPRQRWHDWFCVGNEICELGDLNGDGRADLVAFNRGTAGDVYVATSTGAAFSGTGQIWHAQFCLGAEVCTTGDVNGDGRDDVVSFDRSNGDVHVALSWGDRLLSRVKWHDWFCVGGEQCEVADINGDARADLVAFARGSQGKVWGATSTGAAFTGTGQLWTTGMCLTGDECRVADTNRDDKADVVVFER